MWSEWCSWSDSPLSITCIVAELYLFVVSVVLIRILERGKLTSPLAIYSSDEFFRYLLSAKFSCFAICSPANTPIWSILLLFIYLFILPGSSLISCQRAKIPRVM